MNKEDTQIFMQLRDGDERAFALIFDRYYRYLYVLASRYLMSEEYAEDAVQHTFMKLWEGRETFDYGNGIKNLLFTILKNYLLNEIRRNNVAIQKNYEMAQMAEEQEEDIAKELEDADFKAYFYSLIDRLPPQKREVCLLKIREGLSNQEVADAMNITVPTVKSHYTQVIKLLRAKLGEMLMIWLMIRIFFD